MRFFSIDPLGDEDNEEFCFVDGVPEGLGAMYYRMAVGKAIADEYPPEVKMRLEASAPGIQCATLLGNTNSFLILDEAGRCVVEDHCADAEIEYLPLLLMNHKDREHSRSYCFVNPIGAFDCLNLEASEIQYSKHSREGEPPKIVEIRRYVLDPAKLGQAPALFRVQQDPRKYVVSEPLAQALQDPALDNIELTELAVTGSGA